jgi:L-asparaginase
MKSPAAPMWDLYEMSPLLDSSDITVKEWNKIAQVIFDNYNNYDGFVVLHGTDTMAYTASALSFILDGLNKPVVLTGSQIPLSEIRSDGKDNLVTSLLIAADGVANEVCLYFSGKLLRGNRAVKMSADKLVAFDSPNYPHLADAGITVRYNHSAIRKKTYDNLKMQKFSEIPIGVLKVFPGIQFGLFESIMTDKLSGIVLETFGAGNIPSDSGALIPIIKRAFESGSVITVCSQCPSGTVTLGAYETSSAADSLIAGELEAIEVNKKGKTSQMDAIKDVNSGVTDYAVVDILLAQSLAGQGDYADLVINTGIEIGAEYYAIGFKKGSELTAKVNVILEALGKVGYTTELATKYGLENSLLIKG